MTLVCVVCATTYDRDSAPDVCAECDGKLIDSRVRYEREQEEAWAVECAWEAYHTTKAEPTYQEGCLTKHQAA